MSCCQSCAEPGWPCRKTTASSAAAGPTSSTRERRPRAINSRSRNSGVCAFSLMRWSLMTAFARVPLPRMLERLSTSLEDVLRGCQAGAEDASYAKPRREVGRDPQAGRATLARGRLRGALGGGDSTGTGAGPERDLLVFPLQGPPLRRGAGGHAARDRGSQAPAPGRRRRADPVAPRPVPPAL